MRGPASRGNGNLAEQVYLAIKGLILRSEILPGQKLHLQELSDRLEVSRTPVREALSRLVQEDYASLIPNRGYFVKEISIEEAEELYDVREAIEVFAVRKAVERATADDLRRLAERVERYGRDIYGRFTRERLLYDQAIHLEIARIAGNRTLERILRQVFERIILKRKTDGRYDPARGLAAHREHQRLLRLIRAGRADEAVACIRDHIREGKANVIADLRQREEMRRALLEVS
ncbi:MAG TPA: GntR family transcriptional regulator [Thermodesulfobacteriota bacterium]|nr:GntR family transcriptional regulator [Thermodesulfobacteriota bacterium]